MAQYSPGLQCRRQMSQSYVSRDSEPEEDAPSPRFVKPVRVSLKKKYEGSGKKWQLECQNPCQFQGQEHHHGQYEGAGDSPQDPSSPPRPAQTAAPPSGDTCLHCGLRLPPAPRRPTECVVCGDKFDSPSRKVVYVLGDDFFDIDLIGFLKKIKWTRSSITLAALLSICVVEIFVLATMR